MPVYVEAVYDYDKQHTDELSFKKGDVIEVLNEVEGGWWEGILDSITGWFPSNYVTKLDKNVVPCDIKNQRNLMSFQKEILLHIIEGEVRQISEMTFLIEDFIVNFIQFSDKRFLSYLPKMKEIFEFSISIHRLMISKLEKMQRSNDPHFVGLLFIDLYPKFEKLVLNYADIHLYLVTGLDLHEEFLKSKLPNKTSNYFAKVKQQLFFIFDRINRYPLLLKEMERYLETDHHDRAHLLQAIDYYNDLSQRIVILRKIKESNMDVICASFINWVGNPFLELTEPLLTTRIIISEIVPPLNINLHERKHGVLAIFPSDILFLSLTSKPDTYELLIRCSSQNVSFTALTDLSQIKSKLDQYQSHFEPTNLKDSNISSLNISFQISNGEFLEYFISSLKTAKSKLVIYNIHDRTENLHMSSSSTSRHLNRFSCLGTTNELNCSNNDQNDQNYNSDINQPRFPRDDSTIQLQSSAFLSENESLINKIQENNSSIQEPSVISQDKIVSHTRKRHSYQNRSLTQEISAKDIRLEGRVVSQLTSKKSPQRLLTYQPHSCLDSNHYNHNTTSANFYLVPHLIKSAPRVRWPYINYNYQKSNNFVQSFRQDQFEAFSSLISTSSKFPNSGESSESLAPKEYSPIASSSRQKSAGSTESNRHLLKLSLDAPQSNVIVQEKIDGEERHHSGDRSSYRISSGILLSSSVHPPSAEAPEISKPHHSGVALRDNNNKRSKRADETELRAKDDILILQIVESYHNNPLLWSNIKNNPKNFHAMSVNSNAQIRPAMIQNQQAFIQRGNNFYVINRGSLAMTRPGSAIIPTAFYPAVPSRQRLIRAMFNTQPRYLIPYHPAIQSPHDH